MILDASAVLALLHDEPGAGVVRAALPEAAISAVNLTEAIGKLGRAMPGRLEALEALALPVVRFETGLAHLAGQLLARHRGVLSLGDCACIATAAGQGKPVLTADRVWAPLGLPVEVRLIR